MADEKPKRTSKLIEGLKMLNVMAAVANAVAPKALDTIESAEHVEKAAQGTKRAI